MNSSFEKYIKAAMDAHQYSVVCEMANVIYPEKNKINMMTYPGKDVRIYKNREDEVQILCPNDITFTQESNITKAISTGTIFDDADEVDKYAGFIVKTKMPVDAMTNKGLENPYKIKEMVGSTIGVMDEDGGVDVSDTDVDNGNNVIDDLLKKDSKEFKDVKDVVDDYLGNDSHEFGYDNDFTADIQQLRDEINNFKDADISPEDSITDDDWNDDWGSATSIMGDHNDAKDERDSDDEPSKAEDNLDVADDDDEDENNEDDELTQEAYSLIVDPSFVQEGAITLLKEIGYNPMTRTFVTDVPVRYGKPGEKEKCRLKIGGSIARANGPCFTSPPVTPEPTIHIPVKSLIGDKQKLLGLLKHEEGHFYVSLNRRDLDDQFDHGEKIVSKYGSKMTDHENSREEYVADLYSANHTSDAGEGLITGLKEFGFKNRKSCTLITKGLIKIDKFLTSVFKLIRNNKGAIDNPKIAELAKSVSDELIDIESTTKQISKFCQITIGYGNYSKSRDQFDIWRRYGHNKVEYDNAILEFEKKFTTDSVELKQSVGDSLEKLKSRAMKSTVEEIDILEARLHKLIKRFIKHINEYRTAYDFGIKVRIANIRKYGNKAQTESFEYDLEANDCSIYLEMLADEPMEYQFTQEEYEILQELQYVQEGVFKSLKKIGYDPKTKTFVTDIPVKNGKPGEKRKCKVAINSAISIMNGPCFTVPPVTPEPTLHIPLKYMIGNTDKLMGIIKHEEGHFYVSLNRDDMKDEFDKAGELVFTYGPEMSDHGNFPEEYIADTYSAKHTDDNAEGLIKFLEAGGKKNHKNVVKIIALFKASAGIVKVIFKILRSGEKTKLFGKTIKEHIKQLSNNYKSSDDITKRLIAAYTEITLSKGPGQYSKELFERDKYRVKSDIHKKYFEKMQKYIDDFGKNVDKLEDIEDEITGEVELDLFEQRCLKGIEKAIKLFQEFDEATLKEHEIRIKNIRDKNNGMIKEYATESAKPVPEYKTRKPLSLTHFLEIDDTANHDSSDVDYKADEESNTAELSKKPSNGDNINTTMEEDTTTPMPMFSSGPEMQTEQTDDDELGYKLPEPIKDDKSFTKKITESTKVKEVVPDDLNAAPSDNHNPLLSPIHEGFMLKRPKKLKAIDVRGIASYVTVEMNAIKDSNDQAMLAGYVCSKLELIDFYLTVIDTNDDRYIVPHSRQYLVDGQRQLSDLLTKILRIRPINKSSRIWQIEKI